MELLFTQFTKIFVNGRLLEVLLVLLNTYINLNSVPPPVYVWVDSDKTRQRGDLDLTQVVQSTCIGSLCAQAVVLENCFISVVPIVSHPSSELQIPVVNWSSHWPLIDRNAKSTAKVKNKAKLQKPNHFFDWGTSLLYILVLSPRQQGNY